MPNLEDKQNAIKELLSKFTPEQRGIAETLTRLKVENSTISRQLAELKGNYDSIYRAFLTILAVAEDQELRINQSQFLRFKEEYRVESFFDGFTQEMVFRLRTLKD
jgi:hypothetical protein